MAFHLSWLALLKVALSRLRRAADSAPRVVNKMCDDVLQWHEQKLQASARATSRGHVSDLT
jgi:hypothetical protein